MTASSGASGFCANSSCSHANNEHNYFTCKAHKCRVKWKICQTMSHDTGLTTSTKYAICKKCTAHPGGGPDGFEEMLDLA
ncbi:hypothetical protein DL98DRAFT_522200 [Cadophora sp. DSE1049]|uniref:Uncharacterized protein n=1 Tax=Amylocarpus encephaloides TaxID=45428 RepID=A0A9P7YHP2_9HELO|nr:hypothetical protein BJ875DRAFT_51093 [Amylocarpus encephaloides]PVH69392.1 hypothetical protein DL98DRAFT_522200 [Cadophora sp. DSE1049]